MAGYILLGYILLEYILLGYILLGYILLEYMLRMRWAFFAGWRLSVEADAASVSLYFLLSLSLYFLGNILGMRGAFFAGSRRLMRASVSSSLSVSVSLPVSLSLSLSLLGKILGMRGDDESCRLVCRISARGERRLERAWQTQVGSELPAELPDTSTSYPTSSNVWRRGRLEKYVWSSCQSWAPSNVIESQSSVEKWGQICALKIGQLWTNVFKTWLFINFVIAKTRWYRS